jgi:hypothetical protein
MMNQVSELIKESFNEHKTSNKRTELVRLAINNLYNHFDSTDSISNKQLRKQYKSFLSDPRRI